MSLKVYRGLCPSFPYPLHSFFFRAYSFSPSSLFYILIEEECYKLLRISWQCKCSGLGTDKRSNSHRKPTDLLVLFYACADSSKWGLFGRYTRSAFRCTPSGRLICSMPILKNEEVTFYTNNTNKSSFHKL